MDLASREQGSALAGCHKRPNRSSGQKGDSGVNNRFMTCHNKKNVREDLLQSQYYSRH